VAKACANTSPGHGFEGPGIHFNGVFLPWHRYFTWLYETALIKECQYTGAQPYWDWTLDNPEYGSSFEKSSVFDPVTGFGGNGVGSVIAPYADQQAAPPGNCIGDGPFQNLNLALGYGFNVQSNPHCLIRDINATLANDSLGWTKNILPLLAHTDYVSMAAEWDYSSVGAPTGPHGAGHKGVGGEVRLLL
jgi:tyrosinase